jgi:hypothetical protein
VSRNSLYIIGAFDLEKEGENDSRKSEVGDRKQNDRRRERRGVKGPLPSFDFILEGEIQTETYYLEAQAPISASAVVFIEPQKELDFNPTDQIDSIIYTNGK